MKPTLVIMAAGMGSRYGGLKQIDPVGPCGELIIDYSIYDAIKAGFGDIIFIITEKIDAEFKEIIGNRISRIIPVQYVHQNLDVLPRGCDITVERGKPWGTAQAVLCCRGKIKSPFIVINADDFYGADAFRKVCGFLSQPYGKSKYNCCMAGYYIENTLTEYGHVARGVCKVSDDGYLTGITERIKIELRGREIVYIEGDSVTSIEPGTAVSMNMWGFPVAVLEEFEQLFKEFLERKDTDLAKSEFFLPLVVDRLLSQGKASVKVLKVDDKWYGVTYREDKAPVQKAIRGLIAEGKYPERLWPIDE